MIITQSTVTLQRIVNIVQTMPELEPVLNVAGDSSEPALTIANDVMNEICAQPFPQKWNEITLPYFYSNSWQQDYALVYTPTSTPPGNPATAFSSLTNLSWLQRGICVNINSTSFPKASRDVECGRQLPASTGTNLFQQGGGGGSNPLFLVNFFPNYMLYYGTWGATNNGTESVGNNPVAGSAYTAPLGTLSMPANPINQIQDANGNLLVLTTYGIEGTAAPVAAANAPAGTQVSGPGASTVWTVVDPNGQGIRVFPPPSQTGVVWQFQLVGQMTPIRFTSLSQKLYPLTDEFEPNFRQGFTAQCYRYSSDPKVRAKFKDEWVLWKTSLLQLRQKQDRELEENKFVPDRTILGGRNFRASRWRGGSYPFNY